MSGDIPLSSHYLPSLPLPHPLPSNHPNSCQESTSVPRSTKQMHSFNETPDGGWCLPMALQSCWRDCNTWANCEGRSLSLQSAPCPPVCAPQTLVLVLVPPGLKAGAWWCLSPQLLLSHHLAQSTLKVDKIVAVPTFKPCHLKVVVPQKWCPWWGCSPPLLRRCQKSSVLTTTSVYLKSCQQSGELLALQNSSARAALSSSSTQMFLSSVTGSCHFAAAEEAQTAEIGTGLWQEIGVSAEWKKSRGGNKPAGKSHCTEKAEVQNFWEQGGKPSSVSAPPRVRGLLHSSDRLLWKPVPNGHCCWAWQGVLELAWSKLQLLELSMEFWRLLWMLTLNTDLSWALTSEIPPACLVTKILGGEIQLVIFTKLFPTSLQRMPLQGT